MFKEKLPAKHSLPFVFKATVLLFLGVSNGWKIASNGWNFQVVRFGPFSCVLSVPSK